ncbi:uncharacterized protein DUF3710 [Luteococcus japonicus]|uniref:DUF3710 domain-containing protein n=2 Tax=Luteococcus japonicus TaxID=33984 RepID=A0A1R4K625_9ACTN|nr:MULTISPECIES: DUF3710 domain-containing protein [Luteococcus]MDN5563450.1 DUF3710 domain-containing protein [Luteococcus sp.]ROR53248.1 uncharacterized protein DUF3710 [Luteococcus japonicus]SJN39612.1 hypothetical protein FM114_11635 [Luteococcus japonicus LSP_Lj1]
MSENDQGIENEPQEQAEVVDPTDPKWDELDAQDWREDGPFDLDEVDLDADDVDRLDFGSLIMTPFDEMQLQLQIDEATQQVQAALVMHANSALEVAVFGAPATSSMAGDIRREMVEVTEQQGGDVQLAEGPFGTEIRRVIPLQNDEGETMYHVSRTWFAHGPRWLVRGVLMGEAGMTEGTDGPAAVLYEFFRNLVVRRDESPRVPGDLIPMTIPEELVAQAPEDGEVPEQ